MGKPSNKRLTTDSINSDVAVSVWQHPGWGRLIWAVISLVVFGTVAYVWATIQAPKPGESRSPTRQPSDAQPPFEVVQNGQTWTMQHLMGYDPIVVELRVPTGEPIQFNDDLLYQKIEEIVGLLTGPYRTEWEDYLTQTTLAANAPKRNFFVMVSGPEYPGITEHLQAGGAAATFQVANEGRYLEIWVDGYVLAGWDYMSYEDQVFTASSLLHEMRHMNDYERYPELGARKERGMEALNKGRATTKASNQLIAIWQDGMAAVVIGEMLAYNDQFAWIKDNSPTTAKQLAERPTPEIQPIYLGWSTGDPLKFAQAVVEGYKVDLGVQDLPTDLWKPIKKDVSEWAAEDYAKILETEHSSATAR